VRQPVARPVAADVAATVRRAVEQYEQNPEQPLPPPPFTSRKLSEPDPRFVRELATRIKGKYGVEASALVLGCTRKQWKRWRQRTGGIYDDLRRAIAEATAYLEMELRHERAKKDPGAALKELRRHRMRDDAEPEPEARAYQRHGLHSLRKALPALLDRVRDDSVPTNALSPVEQAAGALRR
jgi:hypothetical protein